MARRSSEEVEGARAFQVAEQQAGNTLAALVRGAQSGASWKQAKAWCMRGKVRVDGEVSLDPARRMVAGERVSVCLDVPRHVPNRIGLVHVDEAVVVVDKPAGMLSVPVRGSDPDSLVARAAKIVARREKRRPRRLDVVHRIDRGTSGLLVFARSTAAQGHLKDQFAAHTTERTYRALVNGRARATTFRTWIVEDRGDGLRGSWGVFRRAGSRPPEDAREAVTRVTVLDELPAATLVQCRLETGRQHQIRIHMSEAGCPILGEQVYIRDYTGKRVGVPRIMLHAASLGFTHPTTGERRVFTAPDPVDFAAVLRRLGGG